MIENRIVMSPKVEVFPNKYCVKSQLGVTKYIICLILYSKDIWFINGVAIYPKNGSETAKAVFVNKVLQVNAKVINKMYIGNLQIPIKQIYEAMFIVSTLFVSKLYSIAGILKLSNPCINPPNINCDIAINTVANTNILMHTINFARSILYLLYGFTSKSFIVPLLNSSLTIEAAITIPIIKINNS